MKTKNILRIVVALLVVMTLVLTACGGGGTPETSDNTTSTDSGSGSSSTDDNQASADNNNNEDAVPVEPTNTLTPQEQFHELLVIHPEAFEFEITEATHTYVYRAPMLVSDMLDYLLAELPTLGWEGLGKPTLMGHLATLNLQQEGYRLNISMQDNELSQTTRVQMLLSEQ